MRLPFNAMRGYIERLEAGEDIERPLREVTEERDRIIAEYRELVGSEEDRAAFDHLVGLARKVYPYVENHNFYVEHWHHSIFWNRVRELGQILVRHGFLDDQEDIFYLHRYEIYPALYDLETSWAVGTPARGPSYWVPEVASSEGDHGEAPCMGAAARPRDAAGDHHRAVHDHALRDHHRSGADVARVAGRRRRRAAAHRRGRLARASSKGSPA